MIIYTTRMKYRSLKHNLTPPLKSLQGSGSQWTSIWWSLSFPVSYWSYIFTCLYFYLIPCLFECPTSPLTFLCLLTYLPPPPFLILYPPPPTPTSSNSLPCPVSLTLICFPALRIYSLPSSHNLLLWSYPRTSLFFNSSVFTLADCQPWPPLFIFDWCRYIFLLLNFSRPKLRHYRLSDFW